MMPGATHCTLHHQTFCQWPAVMRTRRADTKKLIAAPRDKNRFAKRVAQEHSSITHLLDLYAFFKIRSFKLARFFSHKDFPSCCHIRIAAESSSNRVGKPHHGCAASKDTRAAVTPREIVDKGSVVRCHEEITQRGDAFENPPLVGESN